MRRNAIIVAIVGAVLAIASAVAWAQMQTCGPVTSCCTTVPCYTHNGGCIIGGTTVYYSSVKVTGYNHRFCVPGGATCTTTTRYWCSRTEGCVPTVLGGPCGNTVCTFDDFQIGCP
jgi:hypothetical protein